MRLFTSQSPHRLKKVMLLFLTVFTFSLSINQISAQTTLISPTGDGGFETGGTPAANNWTAVNSSTDGWYAGSVPVTSAGSNCGYVSSTAGAAWTYSQVSTIQHLYYTVTIPAGESKVTLSFKWKVGGEGTTTSDWDNMKVFFGPTASITPTANTAISSTYQISGAGATSGMYKLSSAAYNSETIVLTGTPGTTYKLAFSWKSDGTDIVNPPAAIDEVSLISAAPSTYTWTPTSGSTPWTTATNWTPNRTTPNATDILQFTSGGSSTVTGIPATQTVGQIVFGNNTTANFQSSVASTLTIGKLTIPSGSTLMSNGTTAALTLAFSSGAVNPIDGRLEVSNGAIANAINFTNSVTTIGSTGTFALGATTSVTLTSTTSTLLINGTYEHKYTTTSGTIPTATWGSSSNCNIIGYTSNTSATGGIAQNFANFTWNCTSQTGNINLTSSSTTGVSGTFTMTSTNSGSLRWTGTGTYTVNANNFTQTGGTFDLASGASGASATFNVSGTFNQTGGSFLSTGTSTSNPTLHFNGTSNQAVTFSTQPTGPITYRISNPAGITLTGPSASFTLGNGTLGGLRISTNAATPVTFAGTTTAFSYNAANSTLTYDYAGSITATATEFPASSGPARLTVGVGAGNVLTLPFSRSISGILTMTSGDIDISSNTFTLGTSSSALGTLTYTAGNIRVTTGSMTRWFGTTSLPTSAGTGIGYFPLAAGTNNRNVSVYFSTTSALSAAGTITVAHSNSGGLSTVSPSFVDGSYTVDTRTNSSWTLTTGGGITASGTASVRLTGGGSFTTPTVANLRVIQAAAAAGTHTSGTGSNPNFQASRTGLNLAQLGQTHYIGAGSADIQAVYNSVTSGDWSSGSTWDVGTPPTCTGTVNILSTHNVTVNSASNVCKTVTINSGGTLTVASGDVTVGCTLNNNTLTNNGTLAVTGGTLNVNGNIVSNSTSVFNQSGGSINIDGNAAGVTANSVASGTALLQFNQTNSGINLTGGVLTIVDPHAASTASNVIAINNGTAGTQTSTAAHTTRFGDGVSTDVGGNTAGFRVDSWTGTAFLSFGSIEINGGTGTNRSVTSLYQLAGTGNVTVKANSTLNLSSALVFGGNLTIEAAGTFINTGGAAASLIASNTGSTLNFGAVTTAQSVTNNGTIANAASSPTANLTSLTVNNSSAGGITLNSPISVSGTLTMTSGLINTTSTNLLSLGTSTAIGTLTATPSNTNMIVGPFARTFAASTTGSSTFANAQLFPVGKGSTYQPIWISPTTTAGGAVIYTGEAFLTNSGTAASGITNLSAATWTAIPNSTANLTNAFIQIGESGIVTGKQILQAPSAVGAYAATTSAIMFTTGTPPTLKTTSGIATASLTGYFAYGDVTPCSVPANQPTAFTVSLKTSSGFNGSFTAAASTPSHYLVVRYPTGSAETLPADYTSYTVGATLGLGTVRSISSATSFVETGLTAGVTYDYYVYSYNNSGCYGPVYNTTSALTAMVTTCAATTGTPGTPTSSAITTTSFTATWTASSTSGVDYIVDVATDNGFTSFVSGYNGFNVGTALTTNITGLSVATTYYVRVTAVLSGCFSAATSTLTVTTDCNPVASFPYFEGFESLTANNTLPSCMKADPAIGGKTKTYTASATATNNALVAKTGTKFAAVYWSPSATRGYFFSAPITLTAGVSYDASVFYKTDGVAWTDATIYYGTSATAAAMTTTIATVSNAAATTYTQIKGTFIPASTGTYYVAISAYNSTSSPNYIAFDDFTVDLTPSCTGATGGTATAGLSSGCGVTNSTTLAATGYSAGIGLTYQWQKSTDNFVSDIQNISGATNPATASTGTFASGNNYYRLKVTCTPSSTDGFSNTLTIVYSNPTVLTTTPGARCGTGTVSLEATTDPGNTLNWYTAASGGAAIGTGSPFTTPSISSTTTYYVGASAGGSTFSVGLPDNNASYGTFGDPGSTGYGLYFTSTGTATISSVYVYPQAAGTSTIQLQDGTGALISGQTTTVTFVTGDIGVKTLVPLNFSIPAAGSYRLMNTSGVSLGRFNPYSGSAYPLTYGGTITLTQGSLGTTYYYSFFDWSVSTSCAGTRTAVTATVNTPPTITTMASPATICEGYSSTLSATSSNGGYTYAWSSGSATVTPVTTTTYTVTATDNTGGPYAGCATTGTVTVTVNPLPVISVTPVTTSICSGSVQTLSASESNTLVVGTGTSTNSTTGYPSPLSNYFGGTKHQMIILASELTALGLTSGANISSIGFDVTAVGSTFSGTLSSFTVDMALTSTSALGSTFLSGLTNVRTSASLTVPTSGLPQTLTIPITPFQWNGTSNIVIQTSYSNANTGTTNDYVQMKNSDPGFVSTNWYRADASSPATILAATTPSGSGNARPNMVFTWSAPSTTWLWSPTSDLFTNAAATTPYTNQNIATVYAKPTATTTYTVTATSAVGCMSSVSSDITVDPVSFGGTVTDAFTCHPTTTNSRTLTLAGNVGTVVRWESSLNSGFTSPTTIVNTTTSLTYTNVATTTFYRAVVQSGSCAIAYSSTAEVHVGGCNATLNLTAFIEGYMDGATMRPVKMNSGIGASSTDCDDITVELHNTASPYAMVETFTGTLHTDGTLACTFSGSVVGNSYYIVLKHRNAVETWSGAPVSISASTSYNFSSGAGQAYGSNMVQVGSIWCIYSGDIDGARDGSVDPSDYILWETDNNNFTFGYYPTDLNGDGTVDPSDYTIWETNNNLFIFAFTPP